ncbi:MAG: hypothetical protein KF729_21145 [Sandaracinaceae bacterium]|nr:hypothetical protein [Sandaracinaceae bacterium]
MNRLGLAITLALVGVVGASTAAAQSLEDEQGAMDGEGASGTGDPSGGSDIDAEQAAMAQEQEAPARLGDEQAEIADEEQREVFRDTTDPRELEDTDYFFLGAFSRAIIVPSFMQQLFVDGGIDGFNPAVGLTFNWRRNNFNVIANVWWNNAQGDGFFRASGDPRTSTEHVQVNLGVIFVNAEFLWAFPVTDWFAFEVGFDLGVGFIYGELVRHEAYETPGVGDWRRCNGPGDPATGGYCEPAVPSGQPCYAASGGHYNCVEPNWFTEGGDTPFIFPWVSFPHLALRFKPIHQLQIRVDGGWGIYNFFFGGSVSYGF